MTAGLPLRDWGHSEEPSREPAYDVVSMAAGKKTAPRKLKPAPEKWQKAFDRSLPKGVQRRKMFGYAAAFVGGNMAAGLYEDGLVLRLSASEVETLIAKGGRPFEPMPGRIMRGFVLAPDAFAEDVAELRAWLDRAIAFASSLPPKAPKART